MYKTALKTDIIFWDNRLGMNKLYRHTKFYENIFIFFDSFGLFSLKN